MSTPGQNDHEVPEGHEAPVDGPPHLDPVRWHRLVESIGPNGILVAISQRMSARVRQLYSPEDIWQETLHHAWRDREKHDWRDERSYRGWLLVIAFNRIHDIADQLGAAKRGGGQNIRRLASVFDSTSAGEPAVWTTASQVAVHREEVQRMEDALLTLPEEQRIVMRLHLFEEMPMAAVAEQLGLNLSTAWYRFRKAAEAYARRLRGGSAP